MTSAAVAPICLFVYARPSETRATVTSLQGNSLSQNSDLYIFSDAARPGKESEVQAVREYIRTIDGFKSVTIHEASTNQGLAQSIILGVTAILESHGKVIVLEDDIMTSQNFLAFMNQALEFYSCNSKVFGISGFAYPMESLASHPHDNVFGYRCYSWGWATWLDRWKLVDWGVRDFSTFQSRKDIQKHFNRGGSDLTPMLTKQMAGRINSWMIRWVYCQFQYGMLDVYPRISKTRNIGFGNAATHTDCGENRYLTLLDPGVTTDFKLDPNPVVDPRIQREYESMHSRFRRAFYKTLDQLPLSLRRIYARYQLAKLQKLSTQFRNRN
ncbi:MAG: hypothetical protein RL173_871 [Fibrobacterota bacterium]|jgi:hypothetical protein